MSESMEFGLTMAALVFAIQLPVYLLGGWLIWRMWRRFTAEMRLERKRMAAMFAQAQQVPAEVDDAS